MQSLWIIQRSKHLALAAAGSALLIGAAAAGAADTQVDRVVLGYLSVLIDQRVPGLVATADSELSALDSALLATQTASGQWQPLSAVTLSQREHVDATIGTLLETLATVPDLLEVPPAHGVPPTH